MPGASHKILILDDSPLALEAGRVALEQAGFEVLTLDNPLTITSAVRRERPDLALIDVDMPTLGGDSVVQILHQHGSRLRVVLYSALTEEELAAKAQRCGADGFIRKTHSEVELIAQVRTFLDA